MIMLTTVNINSLIIERINAFINSMVVVKRTRQHQLLCDLNKFNNQQLNMNDGNNVNNNNLNNNI